jgi:FtsH-binding integral membrane protein
MAGGRGYVRCMRAFPILAAMIVAAALAGSIVDFEHWFGGNLLAVAAASLAGAVVALNWCELWATRRER